MSDPTNPAQTCVSGRTVIVSSALIPTAAIQAAPQHAPPQTNVSKTADTVISSEQSRVLGAFLDGLVPNDENGPGAVDCEVRTILTSALGITSPPRKRLSWMDSPPWTVLCAPRKAHLLQTYRRRCAMPYWPQSITTKLPICAAFSTASGGSPWRECSAIPLTAVTRTPPTPYRKPLHGDGHGH